jgi:hypothetical protein
VYSEQYARLYVFRTSTMLAIDNRKGSDIVSSLFHPISYGSRFMRRT